MKRLFYLLLLSILYISCKEQSVNQEIPYTTLAHLSGVPDFRFTIKSSTLGKPPYGEPYIREYLVVINDQNTYLDEVMTAYEHPFINFSTHTLLALDLEHRGKVTLKPRKEGDKTILTVVNEIPELGPQGAGFFTYSAIIPKVDSANVIMELIDIHVK